MIELQPAASLRCRGEARPPSPLEGTRLWDSPYLSAEERDALSELVVAPKVMKSGADLMREGDGTNSLFLMIKGWAYRYTTTRDGGRQLPALLLPGDIGNLDFLTFDRPDYGVRAISETSILTLSRDRIRALAAEYPGIARTLVWLALVEKAILTTWALSLGRRSARERVAHLLCELAVRLHADGKVASFHFPLTQEQLGDVLGLTSVHVNRTLQQLRDEKLIATASRTLTLMDVARLRRVAGFDAAYLHAYPDARYAGPIG